MRAVVVVPDGVGIRNFVVGGFLKQLAARGPAAVYHSIPQDHVARYASRFGGDALWRPLDDPKETPLGFTLRWSLLYAHMYRADTRSMRRNRTKAPVGSWRTRAAHHAARALGRVCATAAGVQFLNAAQCRTAEALPEVARYRAALDDLRPSVLFSTNQRAPSVLPIVLAARSLGIPTATFIFSWDNLTSKGRIAAPFDHFLVWSEHMRDELLRYYPHVSPGRVHVVGAPQFDPYADPALRWTRGEFFARIGADPERPLICYSGGDQRTCPDDPAHVRILMELIRSGRIRRPVQVLVRPAPVDDSGRFDPVCRDYPEILFTPPAWVRAGTDWRYYLPSADDVRFLANLTLHADLNVNMASTMTLDFALRDTPVVNLAFDAGTPPPLGKPVWDVYYQFEHYRPVVETGAARFARSAQELAAHVNAYLDDPLLDRAERLALVELEVQTPIGAAARRVVEALASLAGS